MATDTDLNNVVVNQLTEAQLSSATIQPNQFWCTPDEENDDTKANLDASNLDSTKIANWHTKLNNMAQAGVGQTKQGQSVVVESYLSSDGLSWYRKWSDGWKECGVAKSLTSNEQTTALPLTFSNTNYTAMICYSHTISQSWADNLFIRTKQTSSITTYLPFGNGDVLFVYCCGY